MRWFLRLSYCGAPFHGWQRQPNAVSVQQTVEEALSTVMRTPISITGAGRTDTGVNARTMFAHFDTDSDITDPKRLLTALNRLCGRSVALHALTRVRDDAHARFDATSRTYKYFATTSKSPFLHPLAWQAPPDLDMEAMNEAASTLLCDSDFTSFAKLHSDAKTNICDVSEAIWSREVSSVTEEEMMVFTITADRFLRNMVRAVVGTLVDVGRGKMSLRQFRDVVEAKDRCAAGTSMPPQALSLWDVGYPYPLN